jgi:rhodanese-related sulfurtransferase
MQEYIEFFQNHMILSLAWVGLVVAVIMNFVKAKTAGYKEISPAEATHFINREEGTVVDIRSRDEFRQGHIAGSVHVLAAEIKSGSVPSLEKHKANPMILVCNNGQTVKDSANLLAKGGFEKVYVLKNGLSGWSEAKMPLVRGKK